MIKYGTWSSPHVNLFGREYVMFIKHMSKIACSLRVGLSQNVCNSVECDTVVKALENNLAKLSTISWEFVELSLCLIEPGMLVFPCRLLTSNQSILSIVVCDVRSLANFYQRFCIIFYKIHTLLELYQWNHSKCFNSSREVHCTTSKGQFF